jgi:hypothetical protein
MPHKKVPCYSIVAEAVQRKDLCADVGGLVGSCFDEEDRVAGAREIGGDCTCESFELGSLFSKSRILVSLTTTWPRAGHDIVIRVGFGCQALR